MSSVLLVIIVGSQIEQQLLSTGAFEVFINGKLVTSCMGDVLHCIDDLRWSKLESGRIPSIAEMRQLITEFGTAESIVEFVPMDHTSFAE